MNVQLRVPVRSERHLLRRLMELYLYDFSEFDDSDVDEHGIYGYGDLDYFWFEPTHAAFLLTVDDKLAGFVLVDNDVMVAGSERAITEFFVMRKYRRQGVGTQVAVEVFDRFPARWEVAVLGDNTPAQSFWRRVITQYTGGDFQEIVLDNETWTGPVFFFDNRR
jgi:predicted acetyltransferase